MTREAPGLQRGTPLTLRAASRPGHERISHGPSDVIAILAAPSASAMTRSVFQSNAMAAKRMPLTVASTSTPAALRRNVCRHSRPRRAGSGHSPACSPAASWQWVSTSRNRANHFRRDCWGYVMHTRPSGLNGPPIFSGFFDERTFSIQYVVADPETRRCAIIDPVLDLDEKSGSIATWSADRLLDHIEAEKLTLQWILETYPHADHLSAAGYLKDRTGATWRARGSCHRPGAWCELPTRASFEGAALSLAFFPFSTSIRGRR
jgi:hypothetical protein